MVVSKAIVDWKNGDEIIAPFGEPAVDAQSSAVLATVPQSIADQRVDNFNGILETPAEEGGVEFIGDEFDAGVS